MATPQFYRKFTSVDWVSGEQKNVNCKNINWQWFPRLAHAWDVLWYNIVSVDQIAHGKCDCRTVILAIIFYCSLVSESSVTGLGVYTRRWVYDNITPHSLCYLARVRPVGWITVISHSLLYMESHIRGITQSCTSPSQPPQPCCPSGWAGGSAGLRLCNSLCRTELMLLR